MTYQDPDPLRRDVDPRLNRELRPDPSASNTMWGWIAGVVVLVLLMVFLFGSGAENTRTTDINKSPAAPMITAPPPANTATAPSTARPTPSETTGQSQQ